VPLALDLLTDVFLYSRLAEQEIERERSVIYQEIAQIEDTPDELIHDLFHLDFWRGHPLSRPISGAAATVSRLRRADLLQYLDRRYRPGRIFLAIWGSTSPPAPPVCLRWLRSSVRLCTVSRGRASRLRNCAVPRDMQRAGSSLGWRPARHA